MSHEVPAYSLCMPFDSRLLRNLPLRTLDALVARHG